MQDKRVSESQDLHGALHLSAELTIVLEVVEDWELMVMIQEVIFWQGKELQ